MQEEAAAAKGGGAKGGGAKGGASAGASGEGEAPPASDAPAEASGGVSDPPPGASGGVAAQAPPRPAVVIRKKCGAGLAHHSSLAGCARHRSAHAAARRQERHGGASARGRRRRAGGQETQRRVPRRVRSCGFAVRHLSSRRPHARSGGCAQRGRGQRPFCALFGRDAQVPEPDGRENKHRRTTTAQVSVSIDTARIAHPHR